MNEKLITIKEVSLKNNCPECYSTEGLALTFRQIFKETALYKSITKDIVEELVCTKCKTTIYPVSWTDDIERVYNYQKKAVEPKKVSIKLKRTAWVLIITFDVLIIGLILAVFFPEALGFK